jgi:hypothetical protein
LLDVSYLIAPTTLGPTTAARTLQKLIQFAVAHGPASGVVPPGYADLPADLVRKALATAAAVTNKLPAPPRPKPKPQSTTPTPTTTTASQPFDPGVSALGGLSDFGGSGSSTNDVGTVPTNTPVTTATTDQARTTSKPKPASESLAKVAFAKAGDQISGHASWAILIALTLFCLLGLLFRPVREVPWIAKRLSWLRSRPWHRAPSNVTS